MSANECSTITRNRQLGADQLKHFDVRQQRDVSNCPKTSEPHKITMCSPTDIDDFIICTKKIDLAIEHGLTTDTDLSTTLAKLARRTLIDVIEHCKAHLYEAQQTNAKLYSNLNDSHPGIELSEYNPSRPDHITISNTCTLSGTSDPQSLRSYILNHLLPLIQSLTTLNRCLYHYIILRTTQTILPDHPTT